jgi:seryl-tRNA synthetase
MDKTLKEDQLPIRYLGYSTAFRKEAGSYGRDVK